MCLNNCNCITRIVSKRGATGAQGAQGIQGIQGPAGAAGSPPPTYYTYQGYSSTNDIYAGGSGYLYQVSGGLPAGSNVVYDIMFNISSTAARTVTLYPVVNSIPDTTYQVVVTMPAPVGGVSSINVPMSGFAAYATGNSFKIMVMADSGTGTPVLKTVMGHYYVI